MVPIILLVALIIGGSGSMAAPGEPPISPRDQCIVNRQLAGSIPPHFSPKQRETFLAALRSRLHAHLASLRLAHERWVQTGMADPCPP